MKAKSIRERAETWHDAFAEVPQDTILIEGTDGSIRLIHQTACGRWMDPEGHQWLFLSSESGLEILSCERLKTVKVFESGRHPRNVLRMDGEVRDHLESFQSRFPISDIKWTGFGWLISTDVVELYVRTEEGKWICDVHTIGRSTSTGKWSSLSSAIKSGLSEVRDILRTELFELKWSQ